MKIKYTIPCEIDVDTYDLAEIVANADAEEQASFFDYLVYHFDTLPVMDKDIQISHLVDNLFMDDNENDVRRFLEQMLSWFDYYDKQYNNKTT